MAKFGSSFLGKYLIKNGILSKEQLQMAIQYQKEQKGRKKRLGTILVEIGMATEKDISEAIAAQAGVPFISLNNYKIDKSATNMVDTENIKKYQALPIAFEDDKLVVAMAQPRNVIAIDDLKLLTGMDIKPVMTTDSELNHAIDTHLRLDLNVQLADDEEIEEDDIMDTEEDNEQPAVQLANLIINQAAKIDASDVHIEPMEKNFRIRFRVDGVLHEMMKPPRKLHPLVVSRIKVMANMDIAKRRVPQDGRMTIKVEDKTLDIRVASLPSSYGEKLTLRILDRNSKLFSIDELGFPTGQKERYQKIMESPYGFILVTGPTGSGKSTTLYAVLNALNSIDKHIITLEDPIERRLDGVNQIQMNRQAGMTFASGLRAILRNDPDIIMVGEIRDHETAQIAVEAALTGHLVLSTLHTNDAAGAITRLNDMKVEPYLTASSLLAVIGQRLARVLCKDCKSKVTMSRKEILEIAPDFPIAESEETIELFKPQRCRKCNGTGYKGRIGLFELLVVSDRINQFILRKKSSKEIRELAISEGMQTMRQNGFQHVKNGITSLEEVLRVVQ